MTCPRRQSRKVGRARLLFRTDTRPKDSRPGPLCSQLPRNCQGWWHPLLCSKKNGLWCTCTTPRSADCPAEFSSGEAAATALDHPRTALHSCDFSPASCLPAHFSSESELNQAEIFRRKLPKQLFHDLSCSHFKLSEVDKAEGPSTLLSARQPPASLTPPRWRTKQLRGQH